MSNNLSFLHAGVSCDSRHEDAAAVGLHALACAGEPRDVSHRRDLAIDHVQLAQHVERTVHEQREIGCRDDTTTSGLGDQNGFPMREGVTRQRSSGRRRAWIDVRDDDVVETERADKLEASRVL